MRWDIIWTIYRKELLESLRDRRTLFTMMVLPVLIYPVLILGMSKLTDVQEAASEARPSRVSVWGAAPPALLERLKAGRDVELVNREPMPESLRKGVDSGAVAPPRVREAAQAIEKKDAKDPNPPPEADHPAVVAARPLVLGRKVDAVLLVWPGFETALDQGGLGHVSVLYDSVRTDSEKARNRLDNALDEYRKTALAGREGAHKLPPGFTRAVDRHDQNVASTARRSGRMLGTILPFMLIMMSLVGGFYSAIDLTAGEKERGTMQTLLCAPLRPSEIISGKFLAVWTIALIGTLANVGSLAATFARITIPGGDIHVSPSAYVLAFLMLAPVSFMVTALYLAVAAMARDFKDGQNYLTPLMMGLMLPMGITMAPGIELNAWTAFVPVINIALLIKSLFIGEVRPETIFLTAVASAAYAVLPLLFAARVFARESVLLGGRESFGTLFGLGAKQRVRPAPSLAFIMFAVVLVAVFYGSLLLTGAGSATTIVVVEYGFFLLPTLAAVAVFRLPFRSTLALKAPPLRGVVASVLLGLSAWTVGGGLLVRLLPPPESLRQALEKILLLDRQDVPLWVVWLAIGVTPAICEELFFRGFMLSAFKVWGKWPALLTTALLFGFAHASIYRLLPTLFLGLVFGYVVWQTRSVVCGMIAHALNNGLMATLARWNPQEMPAWLKGATFVPWNITIAGVALMAAGLLLIRTKREA